MEGLIRNSKDVLNFFEKFIEKEGGETTTLDAIEYIEKHDCLTRGVFGFKCDSKRLGRIISDSKQYKKVLKYSKKHGRTMIHYRKK